MDRDFDEDDSDDRDPIDPNPRKHDRDRHKPDGGGARDTPATTIPERDDRIGYCNPPQRTRWKKGCPSPNPKGRPRRRASSEDVKQKVARRLVKLGPEGKAVTVYEAMITGLFAKAIKGDRKAQGQILRMHSALEKLRPKAPQRSGHWVTVEEEIDGQFVQKDRRWEGPPPARDDKFQLITFPNAGNRPHETQLQIFDRVAATMVTATIDGKRTKVSMFEAVCTVLWAAALKGDMSAIRLVDRYFDKDPIDPDLGGTLHVRVNIGDGTLKPRPPSARMRIRYDPYAGEEE